MPVTPSEFGIQDFAFPVVSSSGSCDYPVVGNVRDGISYDSGNLVGTLEIPDESDVRRGVQYGADGTEYTGTLYVPPDPPTGGVSLLGSLIAIVRQIRSTVGMDVVTVNYYARSSGDTYADPVEFEARRQPLISGNFDGLAKRYARWQLYATEGQATKPARLGKIVFGDITYHVEQAENLWNDPDLGTLIHNCDCVQAVT